MSYMNKLDKINDSQPKYRSSRFSGAVILLVAIVIAVIVMAAPVRAELIIVNPVTGQYLGNLNANQFDPNSVANPYGRYGSQYSMDSINNQFSQYGSQYSPNSATNQFAFPQLTPAIVCIGRC